MKSEDLLNAMNNLDNDIIMEAANPPASRRRSPRRLITVLVAAAVVASLAIGAAASELEGGWFRRFFTDRSQSQLTDSQITYLEENTQDFAQRQTQDGYTLELKSAISDGKSYFIQCKLTAPEGTVLDADSYTDTHGTVFQNAEGDDFAGNWDIFDDDPADNAVTMVCSSRIIWGAENTFSFVDSDWELIIYGLQAHYYGDERTDYAVRDVGLTEGTWTFRIRFPKNSDRTVEFITEPVTCPCTVDIGLIDSGEGYLRAETAEVEVQLKSFKLRALTAELSFQYAEKASANGRFDDLFVVMRDGSKVLMNEDSGAPNYLTFTFQAPILLDEVDHILLPDGTKLPMPQQ